MTEMAPDTPPGDLVARVDFQHRWRTWALFILLLGIGLWCLHDGYIVYPRDNAAWAKLDARYDRPPKSPHDASAIAFNRAAGMLLTVLSFPILAWRSYQSRGEYRLCGDTLRVPGKAPIQLARIRGLDLVKWDRKGVAVVEYAPEAGSPGRVTLNDMIYQRDDTDRIVARIEAHLNAQDAAPAPEVAPPAPGGTEI